MNESVNWMLFLRMKTLSLAIENCVPPMWHSIFHIESGIAWWTNWYHEQMENYSYLVMIAPHNRNLRIDLSCEYLHSVNLTNEHLNLAKEYLHALFEH